MAPASMRRRRHDGEDANAANDGEAATADPAAVPARSERPRQREWDTERERFSALDHYNPKSSSLSLTLRYGLSALMHVVVVGYVVRLMWIGGVLDIARSFLDVKFAAPCGAFPHQEYVVISSNIVYGDSMAGGGFHVRGGMIGGTHFARGSNRAGYNQTKILSVIAPNKPDIMVLDFGDSVVGPGIIDTHVHMNDPAGVRTGWETMTGATAAAARGGVTMVVDMPLNSDPVTVTARDVKQKLKIAKTQHVQVGVWGGLVPENAHRPRALRSIIRAGALGFKAFMIDSGIDAFGRVDVEDLRAALPVIRDLNVPLLLHAEVEISGPDSTSPSAPPSTSSTSYAAWLEARPASMELRAIEIIVDLLKELPPTSKSRLNFRVHVVHASSAASVDLVNRHRDLPLTVETCPHYLLFASEDIADGATEYKCAPAIRDRRNNDALVDAVREGRVDGVASDHSPSPPSMKTRDFLESWGGISGIQYTLPAVWESLAAGANQALPDPDERRQREDRDIVALHRALSGFPARLLGIHHLKGRIADGYHADFVVWDPNATYDAPCAQTQTHTPYSSTTMRGRVLATVVRGKFVYDVAREARDAEDVVFSCGNMAVSAAWLRPHPRPN